MYIELGCGRNPRAGYVGIDKRNFGQKYVLDIVKGLPFENEAINGIYASHFFEHLSQDDIIKVLNECHRVLKNGAEIWIIVPHKDNDRAYILYHKTFFTEETFRDLEKSGKWKTLELIKNERPDIHWKAIKICTPMKNT